MLKRHPDMSLREFIDRYEGQHAALGVKHVANAVHYERRYLEPAASALTGTESGFDVITELWFEDRDEMDRALATLAQPEVRSEIVADEEKQFDRSAARFYVIAEEHTST